MKVLSFSLQERQKIEQFIDFSWKVMSPGEWVPPIKDSLRNELSDANSFFKRSKAHFFMVEDEKGEIQARLMAFIDNLAPRDIGFFGFYESCNNKEANQKLFSQAKEWFKKEGVREIQGPMNFNIYNNYRLMTKGFDKKPFVGEPRNPEYYPLLLENMGFEVLETWRSWDLPAEVISQIRKGVEKKRVGSPQEKYQVKIPDLSKLEEELKRIYPCAMEVFQENYNFTYIPLNEFLERFLSLRPFLIPGSFVVLEESSHQNPVGFTYGYVDPADLLIQANGDGLKAQELLSKFGPEKMVLHTIGLHQDHRAKDAFYCLAHPLIQLADQFPQAIGALAKSGPTVYDKVGKPTREYSVYCMKM